MDPYYQDDAVSIYHGDCVHVIPELDSRPDHLITDPPYSSRVKNGARTRKGVIGKGSCASVAFDTDACSILEVVSRVRAERWSIFFCAWQQAAEIECSQLVDYGLRWIRLGIWVKPNGAPQFSGDRPGMGWEALSILHNTDQPCMWNGGGTKAVWVCNTTRSGHPTGKPIGLMQDLIMKFTDPGDVVWDPWCGGGATLRAAKDCGRRAVGIEISEKYCELAAQKMAQGVLL